MNNRQIIVIMTGVGALLLWYTMKAKPATPAAAPLSYPDNNAFNESLDLIQSLDKYESGGVYDGWKSAFAVEPEGPNALEMIKDWQPPFEEPEPEPEPKLKINTLAITWDAINKAITDATTPGDDYGYR